MHSSAEWLTPALLVAVLPHMTVVRTMDAKMAHATEIVPPQALTDRMRAASRQVHSASDALVNARLLVAFTRVERHGVALSYFWHVFRAIELQTQAPRASPALAPLVAFLPRISRTAAFEADLEYLLGPQWRSKCAAPPAVMQYLAYLEAIARDEPALLIAHLYTQHSAILAGGQMIRRMARKAMQLPDGCGTKTFEFDSEENPKRLQKECKEAIDSTAAKLPTDVQEQLVQEHCKVFQFNNAIVSGFRVSYLDWPMAIYRTVLCIGGRTQLVLVVITAVSACAAAKLWSNLSSS